MPIWKLEIHGMMPNRVIGLTGGIASGKSTMTKELKRLGYEVVDADAIARRVLDVDTKAYGQVVDHFGKRIINPDRSINRSVLRDIVFNDPHERKALEQITHPVIKETIFSAITNCLALTNGLVFVDIPLLFETSYDQYFHYNIVISLDRTLQLERLLKRDSMNEKIAKRIIDAQMPLEEKIAKASHVIENNASMASFIERIQRLVTTIENEIS